jgi:asparagine synthase (glutamine-hydrolysing)
MLVAWHEWKEDCFAKFDGMFAVAIWDKDRLVLGSDPLGEKTLYYTKMSFGWVVCSELSALRSVYKLDIQLGNKEVSSFMSLGYISAPKTAFKDTYRMLPAEIVTLYKDKTLHKRKYWEIPEFRINSGKVQDLSEQQLDDITDTLLTGLKRRMISDVPMCLFLSAGVDSSLVAALVKHELHMDIDCVTVTFQDKNTNNEAIQAKELSDFLGLKLHNVIIDSSENKSLLNSLVNHFGQPFESLTSLAIASMTNSVSDRYKVGLTGFGADEVFSGYGKHNFAYKYRTLLNMPDYSTSILRKFRNISNNRFSIINALFGLKRHQKYIALKTYPLFPLLREIEGFDKWVEERYSHTNSIELEVYMEELENVLPNSRCISVDLGSMKSSMELRTPFLNKELIEILANYDYRSLTAFGQKHILRKLLKRYVPDKLVDRPKQGFSFPNSWLIDQEKDCNIPNIVLPKNFNHMLSNYNHSRNIDKMTSRALILEGFLRS